jgi:protein Mpv17
MYRSSPLVPSLRFHRHPGFCNEIRQSYWAQISRPKSSGQKPVYSHSPPNRPLCTKRKSSSFESVAKSRLKKTWKPVLQFLDWFSYSQSRRPYLTQLCITPFIYCLGDVSAQMIGNDEFDQHRSLRSIIIGVIVSIPSYEWFIFLGRRFNYRSSVLSIGAKVAVNQLFYTPLFNVYFFALHGLLSGEGIMGAVERVKNTVPTSIPRSFLYWPLVTTFNFTYVKPQSRSVATSLFAVFWQSYLSWLNNWAQNEERKGASRIVPVSVGQ